MFKNGFAALAGSDKRFANLGVGLGAASVASLGAVGRGENRRKLPTDVSDFPEASGAEGAIFNAWLFWIAGWTGCAISKDSLDTL